MVFKDNKGRDIIKINNRGTILVARFPDMDEETKKFVATIYADLTGKDEKETIEFLNYNSEDNEFCS